MAFQTPITVLQAIKNINNQKYLLPAIQREFVWKEEQIERIFDSIMRGYPIGSFLFWKVSKESIRQYQFYGFIKNYHQQKSHNQKIDLIGDEEIISILDGQQRLTSLYIGLMGSYASKKPYMRWDSPNAFPKKYLYLNLLKEPDEYDIQYQFQFLTPEEAQEQDENTYWFKVGDILHFDPENPSELYEYLMEKNLTNKFAGKCLFRLSEVICKNPLISYYMEEDQELDRVLNIFIRVNSGGTQLSYSDLLLSIATAQWSQKDAREEIVNFVDEINNIGNKFSFDKDFILKTCLVLCNKDVQFKVDNFNSQTMNDIENNWDKIKESIRATIELVSGFGFNYDTLVSNNAIIPIIYYLYQKDNFNSFLSSQKYEKERESIKKWLTIAILKQTFGGHSDYVLRIIREIIRSERNTFPANKIIERLKGTPKSMAFGEEEIDNLLEYEYGKRYTFSIMSLLYPTLDYNNLFHQDHIHPKSVFTEKRLKTAGVRDEDIAFCLENCNKIPNLQLLEGNKNTSKGKKSFEQWLNETYQNKASRQHFMERNYIKNINLSIVEFKQFYKQRKELLKNKLKSVLL